jgi:mRNA-degrading endonuclease RelE of RelBE toxin-antitoxin system
MRIFENLLKFANTGRGDVKDLQGEFSGQRRLRVGDYRVTFSQTDEILRIHRVRHRSEVYR